MSKNLLFLSLTIATFTTATVASIASSKADVVAFNSDAYTCETNFTAMQTSPGEDTDFVDFNSYA
jgi:hypothetical protein